MQTGDIDWEHSQLRIRNSKSARELTTHLERNVGEAMLAYLQFGRPASNCLEFFLRTNSPVGPLTRGGIASLTREHSRRVLGDEHVWHPHALRHACARHLLASGFTLKRISDHLAHASIRSTTVYAKVDLPALRDVAFESLEGLA
jgi:site-specific recombinase XerD